MIHFIFYLVIIVAKHVYSYNEPWKDEYSSDTYTTPASLRMDANENWTQTVPGKIIFNFEQDRRDQPPLIHVREEPVGRYWRRHSTTTTTAPFIPPQIDQYRSNHREAPIYQKDRFNSAVPPPPTFPNWESIAQDTVAYTPQYQEPTFHNPVITSQPAADPKMDLGTATMPPGYWSQSNDVGLSDEVKSYSQIENLVPAISETRGERVLKKKNSNRRNSSNRGSRRYNNGDVQNSETYKQITTEIPHMPSSSRVPPPVPTLSPWYDGFGK